MDKHSLDLLEFEKIIEELSSYCFSEEGKAALGEEEFFYDRESLSHFLDMVEDCQLALQGQDGAFPVSSPSTRAVLDKLEKEGAVLEESDFSAVRRQIECARKVRSYISGSGNDEETRLDKNSLFLGLALEIPSLKSLEKRISRVITPEGSIDESIPSLASIRRRISDLNGEINSVALSYLSNPKYRDYMQDQTPGQKDGRTVLPIKSQHKQKIGGLVQDVSASGATIFIEPYELVEKNNELAIEKGRYRQEIYRILKELTGELREHGGELEKTRSLLISIDRVYCRARYSRIHDCSRLKITDRSLLLHEARHPLLGAQAVPIELIADAATYAVVISGPNTGGKTVALKTAGLLAVMHQFGMKVPAAGGSELPVFSDVFTDIGDEQSIDLSLSTFSGHMRRISGICNTADDNSLVLLDELGSGTDAVEGGALAMAVLDYLTGVGCKTVVTTHQSSLKNYAFGKPGAANASVEFDLKRLRPTFRLLNGIPGESHALDIAEMMGMNNAIMETAKEYRQEGLSDINTIIKEITNKQQELHERDKHLREEMDSLRRNQEKLERREAEIKEIREQYRRGDIRELEIFIRETRKRLENLIRELREGEISREKTKKVKGFIAELENKLETESSVPPETEGADAEKEGQPRKPAGGPPRDGMQLKEGMEVEVDKNRKRGVLVRKKGRGPKWVVAVGNVKLELNESEFTALRQEERSKPKVDYASEKVKIPLEIDLRGLRYEEARQELRRYLDNAVLQGMERLEIIHGKGEGVLQQAVRNMLAELPAVKSFEFAPPETGGFGKTIVELEKGN